MIRLLKYVREPVLSVERHLRMGKFEKGRDREIKELVRAKQAAEVGRLLLGELDRPLRRISEADFVDWTRLRLKHERDRIRQSVHGEIAKFCSQNFDGLSEAKLAELYERVYRNGSQLRIPLLEFQQHYGTPKASVLRGAPLHATVCISPWQLQFDYPEAQLCGDLAEAVNATITLQRNFDFADQARLPWSLAKEARLKRALGEMYRKRQASRRMALIAAFNLVEAYVNGLAWEFVQCNDTSHLSDTNRNTLTEEERPVSLIAKITKVPRLIKGSTEGPLHDSREPLKSFLDIVKPYRDAIVHASPFSAPERFGGYDKLEKLYSLETSTVLAGVDAVFQIIAEIHKFLGRPGELPGWMPRRAADGSIVV